MDSRVGALRVEQLADPVVVLGPGRDLVPARHLDELQAAAVARVVGLQLLERAPASASLGTPAQHLADLARRDRLRRGEDQRLQHRADLLRRQDGRLARRLRVGRRRRLASVRGSAPARLVRVSSSSSVRLVYARLRRARASGPTGRNTRMAPKMPRW